MTTPPTPPAAPGSPHPPESDSGALVCIVCAAEVGRDDAVCPRCDEPRVRICNCSTFVTLDLRECPACGRVIPRVLSLAERSRRRWRRRLWIAGVAVVALVPAALLAQPWLRGAQETSALRSAGEAALRAGRPDDAVEKLTAYLKRRPEDAAARLLLAEACFARGDVEGGRLEAQRALTADASLSGGRLLLARRLLAAGNPHAALSEARAAAEPEAHALVAEILTSLGRLTEAAAEYDAAMAAAPGDPAVRRRGAAVHAELGAMDWPRAADHRARAAGLFTEILRAGESRLAANPEDAATTAAVARAKAALVGADGDRVAVESLLESFHVAVALSPDDDDLRADVAAALVRAGSPDAAVLALGPGLRGTRPTSAWVRRALLLDAAGARDRAVAEIRVAWAADPRDAAPYVALARLHLAAGRPSEATAALSAALSAGVSETDEMFEVRADAAQRAGDREACSRALSDWRRASRGDPRPLRRLLDLEMPAALAARLAAVEGPDALSEQLARIDELAELDPEDRAVLLWRARCDDATGHPADAARRVARLLALHPEDAAGRVLRVERSFHVPVGGDDAPHADRPAALAAEIAERPEGRSAESRAFVREALAAGMPDLAIDLAASALERAPDDAELVEGLARALVAAGRPDAAAASLRRASDAVRATPRIAAVLVLADALAGGAAGAPSAAAPAPGADDLDALLVAARVHALAGRGDDAAAVFARARAACGGRAPDLRRFAEAVEDAGRPDEARAAWDAALDAAPQDVEFLARGGVARLALASAARAEDRTEAAARIGRLRSSAGGGAAALGLRGAFAAAQGDDTVAVADLRRALAATPERDDLRLFLARALLRLGTGRAAGAPDVTAAADEARRVLARRPASLPARRILEEALLASAADAAESGRLLAALRDVEELAALDGGRRERAPLDVGRATLPPAALARARDAVRAHADDRGHRLLLAIDASSRGAADESESLAAAAAGRAADPGGVLVVRAFLRGAAGRSDDARRDAVEARSRRAPGGDVAFAEAAGLARTGREEEALTLLTAWCQADAPPRLRAAVAALRLPHAATRESALEAFTELLDSAPEEAAAMGLHAWGRALAESGPGTVHARAARRTLRRALARAPEDTSAELSREALAKLR